MSEIWLQQLLQSPTLKIDDHEAFWLAWQQQFQSTSDPFLANILTAVRCARPAFAFLCGYQSALRRLVPELGGNQQAALCVTEQDGNHPRAIGARLALADNNHYLLTGHKSFVTNLGYAQQLLIAADVAAPDSKRKRIKLVRLPADHDGLEYREKAPLGVVPEVTHGELHMRDARVGEQHLLPGDGYQDYIKPFRTLEDLHVAAAFTAFCFGVNRHFGLSRDTAEQLLAALVTFRGLALQEHNNAATHLALNGALEMIHSVFERGHHEMSQAPESVSEAWRRDSQLLNLAAAAREKRRDKAWLAFPQDQPRSD